MANNKTKRIIATYLRPEVYQALRETKREEGLPITVQIDFALRAWLQGRGRLKDDGNNTVID